jgi:hypothetical protein
MTLTARFASRECRYQQLTPHSTKTMIKTLLSIFCLAATLWSQGDQPSSNSNAGSSSTALGIDQSKDPNAQKARALVQQMLQALGGEAYLNLKDITQEGRTSGFYHGNPSGSTAPFWRFIKFPDKERTELTKHRDWIILYTGNEAYEITYRGTKPLDPKDLKEYLQRREYSLDTVLRNWINAPGTAFFYEGDGFVDNRQVDNVSIINAQNQAVTISIDRVNHLPVKKSFKARNLEDRQLDEEEEIYGNYRVEQGFNTAHIITRLKNGEMTSERFLTSVTYNQGLPDSMFAATPPVKAKKK